LTPPKTDIQRPKLGLATLIDNVVKLFSEWKPGFTSKILKIIPVNS